MKASCLLILFSLLPVLLLAQIEGRVFDARTKEALPFATIRFGNTGQGVVAGLDGTFMIPAAYAGKISYIEVSSMGYETQKAPIGQNEVNIYLDQHGKALNEVVFTPPYDKMRRIINNAIDNKSRNNPDKYDWYRCNIYYKMVIDLSVPDSALNDTSKDSRETKEFIENQHLLMSETKSVRTWKQPQKLQEDVIASRFSGFKKSMFTSLVTDILPFHAYNDYITLNGRDYHNPISKGFEQYYKFNLVDEVLDGKDTVWILSFRPRGKNSGTLRGAVYINSDKYAISHITAQGSDTTLMMKARIEQQYERIAVPGNETRWFPSHLNYIIDWRFKTDGNFVGYHMKGNSRIDSVSWNEDKDFDYDRSHTVRLAKNADVLSDSEWIQMRRKRWMQRSCAPIIL